MEQAVSMATFPRTRDAMSFSSELDAKVVLGHTKSDSASKLRLLQSTGWLGGRTVALEVQFTLYSPAPSLFSSVTLLTEQSHGGELLPSAKVQSVRLYHTPAVWDYVLMVCQLLFLFLSLLQLCNQVSTASQQGLMGYWKIPCSWLEVSLLIMTLVYYVYHIYGSTMITEVVELLQRHYNRGHVDVRVLADWEQFLRSLRGVILFLLTMKFLTILRVNRTFAFLASVFSQSLSSLLWPTISGLILLVALSCSMNLLNTQGSWAFRSIPCSLQTLLCHHRGVLSLSSAVWTSVVIEVMSSLVGMARRSQNRRNDLTIVEVLCYIRQKVSEFTGKHRQAKAEYLEEGRTYFLEEFESLVDELLFRLNAITDSLHHTLPPKAHCYREEDSSVISPMPEPSNVDTQDSVRSQTMVNKPTYASDHGESPPAPCLLRSQIQKEIPEQLHQRRYMRCGYPDIFGATDDEFKIKNCRASPESTSPERFWTEDRTDSCCLIKTQAIRPEVVVEVLVHKEPGTSELDVKNQGP